MANPRDDFLDSVRRALGHTSTPASVDPSKETGLSRDAQAVEEAARAALEGAQRDAGELMSRLHESAAAAGWKVARMDSVDEAARYIEKLARDLEAIVRSAHPVLDRLDLETVLAGSGTEVQLMAIAEGGGEAEVEEQRRAQRQGAIEAEIGVTGVDYAIAETGSCVLLPGKGVSRLVSLLPQVHVALVEVGQVLPSLDELFTLRRHEFLQGNLGSYMNIITGPSRSADIEYTLVTGVHGPGEVHMVLLG